MATANRITAERVREILHYDPETGLATVLVAQSNRRHVGDVLQPSLSSGGYVRFMIDKQPYKLHRLIWLYVHGRLPDGDIDHINGDPSDNRLVNLRDVPHQVNAQNLHRAHGHNTSTGLLGASLHKMSGLYLARIKVGREVRKLGYYKTAQEAHAAYVAAKRVVHAGCTL